MGHLLLLFIFISTLNIQVGLFNVDGYFNSLLSLFDKGVEEGFIENSARHVMVIADTAIELIKKMEVRYIRQNMQFANLHNAWGRHLLLVCFGIIRENEETKLKIKSIGNDLSCSFICFLFFFSHRNMFRSLVWLHPNKVGKWTNY